MVVTLRAEQNKEKIERTARVRDVVDQLKVSPTIEKENNCTLLIMHNNCFIPCIFISS
jgi:hypothetical protein